ncbi:MAG: 2-5 ligase family protein [Microbacteriaceae bacterium]|jgi:2'-5' RNA ligase|nr:2-5 ligase family protein [Microbacteriaceae bacterium]
MRSLELTFDETTDAAIRRDWDTVAAAGLPSLASHASASNRPHISIAVGPELAAGDELAAALRALPLTLRFAGFVIFGPRRGSFVLARAVVVSRDLLELHAAAHATQPGVLEVTLPDRWTPHVTLARRLTAAQLAIAFDGLPAASDGQMVGARLWDNATRELTTLV